MDESRLHRAFTAYRWVAFDGPRTTTGLGVVLLLAVAAPQLALLMSGAFPVWLDIWFVLAGVLVMLAIASMTASRSRVVGRLGWVAGSLVCATAIALWVVSRTAGLPGVAGTVGRWYHPGATAVLGLAAVFLLLHTSLLLGVTVAVPDRRRWHD